MKSIDMISRPSFGRLGCGSIEGKVAFCADVRGLKKFGYLEIPKRFVLLDLSVGGVFSG